MAVRLFISGVDRSSLYQVGSLRITKPKGAAHTASFVLVDKSKTSPYYPKSGEHVLIKEDNVRIFAGQIEAPNKRVWHGADKAIETRIQCSDYTRLLHHYWICGFWRTTTAADLLADCFSSNSPFCDINGRRDANGTVIPSEGISYTPGEPGVSIDNLPIQNRPCFDVISELAGQSEYEWSLDYDKRLYFGPRESVAAPFSINDNNQKFRELSVEEPLDEYANETLFLGAVCETNPQFAEYKGDGSTRVFKPTGAANDVKYNILDVAVSDDYPTGCKLIDTSKPEGDPNRSIDQIVAVQGSVEGADWYISAGSMDLSRGEGKDTLTSHHILRFRYTGEYPIWAYRTDTAAIAERHAIEGGGALYQHLEQDGTVTDPYMAERKAETTLAAKSKVPRVVNLEIDAAVEPRCRDLAPGQVMQIQLSRWNLGKRDNPSRADGFVIENVSIEDVAGKWLRYTVELVGSQKTNWIDAMRKALQPERAIKRTGDSTVHLVRRVTERLSIRDSNSYSYSDGIPWVGSTRIGFCECVSGVELVEGCVGPGMLGDYYIAK